VLLKANATGSVEAKVTDVDRRSILLSSAASILIYPQLAALPASADPITVFVAGSTGQTGRRVVLELRKRGFKVRAGVRDLRKAQSLGLAADGSVTLVEADVLKPEGLPAALAGAQYVICATGYNGFSPNGPTEVDEIGTKNLVDAAKQAGVTKFVLLTSLLTNAPAAGQADNPNYKFLNFFGGVLDHKLAAEKYLRASGLTWTVVRPGGLSNEPASKMGNLIVSGEDTLFGLDSEASREISRDTVAEVLVAALQQDAAQNKVVEIVASPNAPVVPEDKWFA